MNQYTLQKQGRGSSLSITDLINERIQHLYVNTDFALTFFQKLEGYAVIAADFDGNIIAYNEGAYFIYGYKPEEVIGKKSIENFFSDEFINAGGLQQAINNINKKGYYLCEGEKVRKNGDRFPAQILFNITKDKEGKMVGFVEIAEDLTARKKFELEIKDLNKRLEQRAVELEALNSEMESFSYSVSHDLRAPIRIIEGFCHILQEDFAGMPDVQAKEYLCRISAETVRMNQLIDDLLRLSRISMSEMRYQEVCLSGLAASIAEELKNAQPSRCVDFSIMDGIVAQGDMKLLRIMLQNLIDNAWKYTSKRPAAQIEFGLKGEQGKTVYFVRDNGAGFDMNYAAKLFSPFQRFHSADEFPGTGIGLSIVQRIVHRHGGNIWCEAETDKGATFYFTLAQPF